MLCYYYYFIFVTYLQTHWTLSWLLFVSTNINSAHNNIIYCREILWSKHCSKCRKNFRTIQRWLPPLYHPLPMTPQNCAMVQRSYYRPAPHQPMHTLKLISKIQFTFFAFILARSWSVNLYIFTKFFYKVIFSQIQTTVGILCTYLFLLFHHALCMYISTIFTVYSNNFLQCLSVHRLVHSSNKLFCFQHGHTWLSFLWVLHVLCEEVGLCCC